MNRVLDKRNHKRLQNFTLLELLVVVAIVGILASLLLPSLGKARKKAQAAVCKSQLKQIFAGFIMYIDDNDETLPFVRQDSPRPRSRPWHWSIAPYLNVKQKVGTFDREIDVNLENHIFKCPTNEVITNYGTDVYVTGYAMPIYAGYGIGLATDSRYQSVKLTNVSSPVEGLLLGEREEYYFNSGHTFATSLYHDGLSHRLFVDGHIGQGYQMQNFAEVTGIPYYWHRWSYNQGY